MNTDLPNDDARSDEQLVAFALDPTTQEDGEEYWSAVRTLQIRMAVSLLEKMRGLILKGNERQRTFAVDVIAQGRAKGKEFTEQCVDLLLETLSHETSWKVLEAICHALGHHKSDRAIDSLIKFQTHEDSNVRLAVVHGLTSSDNPAAIAALISLSTDADRDVRNWATFGLGSMTEMDSVSIREALAKRLTEADDEIWGEALVGLALRGDTRICQPLLKKLNTVQKEHRGLSLLLVEAVQAVQVAAIKHPDDAWQPLLARCAELGFKLP